MSVVLAKDQWHGYYFCADLLILARFLANPLRNVYMTNETFWQIHTNDYELRNIVNDYKANR